MEIRPRGMTRLAVLVTVLTCMPAEAADLRCGKRLIAKGDRAQRVRSLCGEPAEVAEHSEWRTLRRRVPGPCPGVADGIPCPTEEEVTEEVRIEEWTYDFGPQRLQQTLVFEQGVLTNVISGSYGTR